MLGKSLPRAGAGGILSTIEWEGVCQACRPHYCSGPTHLLPHCHGLTTAMV